MVIPMPNPFLQQNNNMNNLKQIYNTFINAKNPQEVFMNIAKNNPRLQPFANMIRNGSNPEQVFYELCKQRGIDPQTFIKQITG